MIMAKQSSKGLQLILAEIAKSKETKALAKIDRAVAYARAQGESIADICEMFGLEPEVVQSLERNPEFIKLITGYQSKLKLSVQERISRAASIALEVKMEQMFSARPEIRERSATFFLEHEIGRPTQKIQTLNMNFQGGSISDLDMQIEATRDRIAAIEDERKLLKGDDATEI